MAEQFSIRLTQQEDLPRIMDIYTQARAYMAEQGNPHQWGDRNWPPQSLIERDIERGKSYVCVRDGQIAAVFYYDFGPDIEPTYRVIEDGRWLWDTPYGVVHRIASAHLFKGAAAACIRWALEQSGHLRIDTHGDNIPMQTLLAKMGFTRTGIIHVVEDPYPRLAFEKRTEG